MAQPNIPGLEYTDQAPTSLSADTTDTAAVGGVPVTGPNSKYMPKVAGTTALGPEQTAELLANMQNLIAQKTGPMAQFMGGIQDALAYSQPYQGGQMAAALQYRNEQKRKDLEDLMAMQSNLATYQSAMGQNQARQEAMNRILGGAQPQGGGAQPDVLGSTEIPPEVRQQIAMDPVNGPTILQKYLQTAATERTKARLNPAWYEMTEVVDNQGQIMKVPRIQAVELAMQNPNNPKNRAVIKSSSELSTAASGAPQLRPQGNAAEIAQGLGIPVVSGYRSPEKQAELYAASQKPGYAGPPVAKPGGSQHQQGNAIDVDSRRMTPEMRQKLVDNGFVQPLPKTDPNHWELAGAREKVAAPSQVAGPAQATTSAPLRAMPNESVESLKQRQALQQKQQEKDIETKAKSGEEARKKAGDAVAALEQNAEKAAEVIRTADRVINHATKYKNEFGYGYQQENPVLATAANIPGVGAIVEKTVPAIAGAPGESARRAQTDTDASKLGLDFAAQMFAGTGARLGVGLEQMAANAKGVGTNLPAATNALNANLVKVAAEKARDQAAAWSKWKEAHGGENADPYGFMHSDINKSIIEKYDRKLDSFEEEAKRIYPEFFGEKKVTNKANRKPLGQILGGQ